MPEVQIVNVGKPPTAFAASNQRLPGDLDNKNDAALRC